MNKKLEEAIEIFKNLQIDDDKEFKKARDIILNYIENSISKEVIGKKIEENGFEVHTKEWGNIEVISIEVLQELLEEK